MATDWAGIVGVALGGASGLVENLFGKSWEEQAEEKEKQLGPAPTFSIPESQKRYEDYMKTRSRQAMPGSELMEQSIEDTTSDTLSRAGMVANTGWGAQGAGLGATENRRRRLRKLGSMQEQYKRAAQTDYAGAVKSRTPYETMQYEYNEWLPWQIQKNEIASIRGAGQQQLMTGMDRGAAMGIYGANMYNTSQMYGNQSGGNPGYVPYSTNPYSPTMNQMGQNQLGQSAGMGSDPYGNRSGTGYIEPWMTQPF